MTAGHLLRIARPKGTALVLVVPLIGYGFAHWDHRLPLTSPMRIAVLLLAWVMLSAGTMWLNSALDGEEASALFAPSAPTPRNVALYGYGALALAVWIAFLAAPRAGLACMVCGALAVLYSHPRTKWKATTLLAPLVSAVGYGLLSALAGFTLVSVPLTIRSAGAFTILSIAIYGLAVAAQSFQRDDDARRGYRTFVVVYSPRACLTLAHACVLGAVLLAALLMIANVYPRLCLLGLPAFNFADRSMRVWRRAPERDGARACARYVLFLLFALAVLVVLAFIDDRVVRQR